MKKTPLYCRHCGSVLERQALGNGFDAVTGTPNEPTPFRICPERNISTMGYDKHDLWFWMRGVWGFYTWQEANSEW